MALKVAMAYLVGIDVKHKSEKKNRKTSIQYKQTDWFFVPSTLTSRMNKLELMSSFGRNESKTMEFKQIQLALKNAESKLNKNDPKKDFQRTYIEAMQQLLMDYIQDVKMKKFYPNKKSQTPLDVVTKVCFEQLKDFAETPQSNDCVEIFNSDLAKRIIETYSTGYIPAKSFNFMEILNNIIENTKKDNNIQHLSKHQSTMVWVRFLSIIQDDYAKRNKAMSPETKQEFIYIMRFGRIIFGYLANLSSTFLLERSFSLLCLNLEKRRHNLTEDVHESEGRIMTFFKNSSEIKKILHSNIFKSEIAASLNHQFNSFVPRNMQILVKEFVEDDENEFESQNPTEEDQLTLDQLTLIDPDDNDQEMNNTAADRPIYSDDDQVMTNTAADENLRQSYPIYSDQFPKSYDIADASIDDIYEDNYDNIQSTGNGMNLEFNNNPVRYPFII